ncbi:polysaccharide deacetylase family protein [Ammoniphilus sp. CFH 90114]|uniref:polysaccharide deacetylase family protein n=1 Tax=Ammoniphilus sp. CFH 90114 TaxID=2493665 RepID=UPI0013E93949|nr:polysaccharide deacetylase family protein [Ammoniphilus sp. CFH 90114]
MRLIIILLLAIVMGCSQQENESIDAQVQPEPAVDELSSSDAKASDPITEEHPYRVWYREQVLVLNYHHLADDLETPFTIKPAHFEEHMEFLKNHHFHPLKIKEFYEFLDTGLLNQENAVLITFDDGYESGFTEAFPILQKYQFPATVFVIYENLRDSLERKREDKIPPLTFVQMDQMRRSGLISFQSHTYGLHFWDESQPITAPSSAEGDQAYRSKLFVDFMMARKALEDLAEEPVIGLAYPYGYHNDRLIKVAKKAGYRYGFFTHPGVVTANTDPFLIPKHDMGTPEMDGQRFEQKLRELISQSQRK